MAAFGDAGLPTRFWAKVVQEAQGCWRWTASFDRYGYGRFAPTGESSRSAYLVAYAALVGPVPRGLQLDHLCRNRACVNPEHLEPVTQAENARRSAAASKTHCVNGHEFTPENTYLRPPGCGGHRDCRACIRARANRYIAKRRAA